MLPFILKPYPIKNKILFLLFLLAFINFYWVKSGYAKTPSLEKAYYFFLLSQIFTENSTEVESYLKKAIEIDKKNIFLKKVLLSHYISVNNTKDAEKLGESLYQKYPHDRDIVYLLSKVYFLQNRPSKSISYLEKYLEGNPKDEELLSLLISLYLQQKEWDKALQKLDQLQGLHPQSYVIWLYKARVYREKNEKNKAKEAYLRAIELSPENRALLLETLKFLESIQSYSEIERVLQEYLDKNPEDKDFLRILLGFYLEQRAWEKSEALLKQYLKKYKDQPEFIFYLGLTLEYKGNTDEALKIYKEIPFESPWHLEAQKKIFELLKKKDLNEAKSYLDNLRDKFVAEKSYLLFLAHAYEEIDFCEEGLSVAKKGLELFPQDPDLTLALASNFGCLDNYLEVLKVVEPLLERFPEDAYILNFVGYSLVELEKDLDRAEELLLKANKLKPQDPYIEDSLGWLYFKLGDLMKAKEYLEQAIRNSRNDEPVIWDHLGDVYFKLGIIDKACELYKRAFEKVIHKNIKLKIKEKLKFCP